MSAKRAQWVSMNLQHCRCCSLHREIRLMSLTASKAATIATLLFLGAFLLGSLENCALALQPGKSKKGSPKAAASKAAPPPKAQAPKAAKSAPPKSNIAPAESSTAAIRQYRD